MKRNANIYVSIISGFLLCFILSLTFIISYYQDSAKQEAIYDELVEVVEEEKIKNDESNLLKEYQDLYLQNDDMVGWIKIDGTKINYPVMQTVDEPNFYLRRGFDKKYTIYGCPYMQENCNVDKPSDNLVIYGHHMNDGTMFANLMKYTKKSFWEEHKTIVFDTLEEHKEYEVMAAFKTVVYSDSPESFKYYHFVDAENEEEFNAFVEKCKELSFYDTGVEAEYGDKFITLSTCEYSKKNSRMVVVAKRVK